MSGDSLRLREDAARHFRLAKFVNQNDADILIARGECLLAEADALDATEVAGSPALT
jgi:hypothetical protein